MRLQVNRRSAFFDGSAVYGHTSARALQLRTLEGGHLKTDAATGLPLNPDGVHMNTIKDVRKQRLTGSSNIFCKHIFCWHM